MKRRSFRGALVAAVAAASVAIVTAAAGASWPQWAQNPQHTGFLNVSGQRLNRIAADVVYDPLVPDERAHNDGDLLVHYQVPLVEGSNVYMESKAGAYTEDSYSTQTWHQNRFTWMTGVLTKVWTFDSDWFPPGSQNDFWEPVYHAVLANGFVYDPGRGGTIFKLSKRDGSVVKRINPFATIDPNTFTVSPLTADAAGNIYYNVLKLQDNISFYDSDAVDSWLVKVAPDDSIKMASYSTLNPGAPKRDDQCLDAFATSALPWPPSADAVPPSVTCGLQRVALNIAPAIAGDGTIYSVTRAHFFQGNRHGFLVAVNPNLTPRWAASLRNRFHDGCGVSPAHGGTLPPNGQPGGCRDLGPQGNTTIRGRDPAQNTPGGGRVLDDSSSTPTIAPDGSILYGAYTRYNYAQGHLMRFSASGRFLGAFGFGWDITPAIFARDRDEDHGHNQRAAGDSDDDRGDDNGDYSIVIKDNHYSGGSYCNDPAFCPDDRTATNPASPEEFFITQLSPKLAVEWRFKSTNTQSCTRNPDGSVTCETTNPHGFEWCVNAPVVDRRGIVYANSEDGNLYAINQGGGLRQSIFQQLALGAAYTPASLGPDGRIYTQNAGHLFVVSR